MAYIIKRTGNIFADLGIIRLAELLGGINCSLKNNFLEITNFNKANLVSAFIKKIDESKSDLKTKKEKKRSSVVGKFITNNALFSQNSVTDKQFKDNFEWLVDKCLDALNNKVQGNICSFCFNYSAELREITNTRYPLLGAMGSGEGFSGFFPGTQSNLHMCYICELLTLLNACKIKRNIVYVPDLVTLKRLDETISFREEAQINVLSDLARFSFSGIKYLNMQYGQKCSINNFSLLSPENLLRYLKAKEILFRFNYTTEKQNEIKQQVDIYLLNASYSLINKILLGHIMGSKSNSDIPKWNLKIYNNFLKEVMGMSSKEIEREFENSAYQLKQKIDSEKIQNICYRILSFLRNEDREELLKFIMHLCITNTVPLPNNISDVLLKYDENTMHYAVGKFVETLYMGIGGTNE